MENDLRNYQNVSKVVKNIPPNFTKTLKTSKCGRGRSNQPKHSASVQKIDKVSSVSSSDPHVVTAAANNTPLNKQSTVCVDETVTLKEMPCSKVAASHQPALHVGHQKVDFTAMTNKNQKLFAKLPGLSNPLLQGLSSGDCDKTNIASLSFLNKEQPQQQKSLNYDVGHVFGEMSAVQSGGAESNQALNNNNNTSSSSNNNLFFTASHNLPQVSGEMTVVCQSSPGSCSPSFANISHQNTNDSIKNNNFHDNSNTQNVNCKMILSGTGREAGVSVSRTPAQPAASDQPISTGETPKPDLPSTSSPCRTETNPKSNMAITDPERLALIKQRKRERKFRKLQSLSALMRAPDDRHGMVQFNPLRHSRITQENLKQESFKQDSINYPSNSTGSSKLGDISQNPFNWMSSSVGTSSTVGTGLNYEKKPWRAADTAKKTCSFFHEPSLRNNSVLSENFSEMAKNRADYKTEKKLIDSGFNSWQLHGSNSSMVDDALHVVALKHIKNESTLDDHLLLSASGKVLDINSKNKKILENFLTPRVKKDESGSESSSSVSSEGENCLSPKIKGLACKEKMWGSPSKKHRPPSKFGGNVVKFKNGETDVSSLDHFQSPLIDNYQKRTRDSVEYEASGVRSEKSNSTSEAETDDDSDDEDEDGDNSFTAKLFGNAKRKSHKSKVKRRGRPPLSDKFKSQSHKSGRRRGRPPLMSNFGRGEALMKQTKLDNPTAMELDIKPQWKCKDDTADNKIPKRGGRPPKKLNNPVSVSASPTPMSIDTPTPAVALSSLNAPTLAEDPNLVDASSVSPPLEVISEELLKARLNLPRRRGRPSKVDVMLREMAAAHLAAGQPMSLPTPEAVAAALAQTAEVPAKKKKKVYARRRYHAYGQRKRRRRKNPSLLRASTVAAELGAGAEGALPSSELARGAEGASRVSAGGVNFHQMVPAHQTAYNEVEEDEEADDDEDEEEEDVEGKAEVYSDRVSTVKEEVHEDKALTNKRHCTNHHHRRHHRHHHHQLQESQGHNNNNNNNNNNNHHHHQLPLSSTPQTLPSSANIVVSLSHLPHRAELAGEGKQLVEEPNAKKRPKKRKKDAGGEGDAKKQRCGEVMSGTSVGSSSSSNNNNNNNINNNKNNNNNSLKDVVKEEEEDSVLLANGNTFRVKMMKSKPTNSAKGPAPGFAHMKGLKKEGGVEPGVEESGPAATAAPVAEKTKSRNKKPAPSSSFSSSSTKAGVIKISRNNSNNNNSKSKINSSGGGSSSSATTTTTTSNTTTTTSTTPAVGGVVRQIAPPVYNVPRVMLPPCIKDDGIACLMCGRVHTQDHFFKYMELKSTETSHRCPLCGQFFSWSCLFIEHMRGHPENTAQYRCEYCGSVSRKISSYFNCRITHCPPSQEWFDLQKACDDYLASLESKSSSAAAKKRRKAAAAAAAAASSPSTPSTKKKTTSGDSGGGDGSSGGGGRSRKKPSAKQQEKDAANASVEKTQSSQEPQQNNTSESSGNCSSSTNSSSSNNKRKGQKQSKGRRSSADAKVPVKSTPKPFVCDVCEKSFVNLKLFTKHKELHRTKADVHSCKECNKEFTNLAYLTAHKCSHDTTDGTTAVANIVHADSNSEGHNAAVDDNSCGSRGNLKCSFCDAVFPDAVALKAHAGVCDGLPDSKRLSGPHTCSVCERSFKFKQSLVNHTRRHTGERPFACESCDKTFMQAGNLERHRRTHERDAAPPDPVEEEKSDDKTLFTCEYCEKVFTVEATYQIHLKVHDSESTEQLHCPYCDKQFPSRHMLKMHKRTHNEHRPFKCTTCSRCYKHKHSLVEHQQNCR